MKKVTSIIIVLIIAVSLFPSQLYSWGFFAHKRINRLAIFTLPPGMIGFYKKNMEYISEHAVDPDKRRYAIDGEAERHFIDMDHYAKKQEDPFENVPQNWVQAVAKFSEDTLKSHGIVPWHIELMVKRLTNAFKEEDLEKILKYSAELGHYIADAHVPLHTTENYNGQLTDQRGIHGFWESRLPELYASNYDNFVGRAKYIDKPLQAAWSIVKISFQAKDSVLEFEAKLNKRFPPDKKYAIENRGNISTKVYSQAYSLEYDSLLNGMVEKRFREAINTIGNFWYTAWVNAGQPDLNNLNNDKVIIEMQKKALEEERHWNTVKRIILKGHED